MLKQIVTYSLILCLLLQVINKTLILAGYVVNRDYIAAVLCVNKTKPKLHCDGRCQLTKELQNDEKRDQLPLNHSKEKSEIHWTSVEYFVPLNFSAEPAPILGIGPNFIETRFATPIFHPPQA